jgi:hypothetical protein
VEDEYAEADRETMRFQLAIRSLRPLSPESSTEQLERWRAFGEQSIASIPCPSNVRLRFGIFESDVINGLAFVDRQKDTEVRFATVSSGALLYIHEFFFYIMSRVDILPDVGITGLEVNLPYKFSPAKTFPPLGELRSSRLSYSLSPKDEVRRRYAHVMALYASYFLIFHEFGHCVHGHLQGRSLSLDEIDRSLDGPVELTDHVRSEILYSHTLEADADSYAIDQLFTREKIFEITGDDADSSRIHPFLHSAFLGIWLLFRILARPEELALDDEGLLRGKHPHQMVRVHFCSVRLRSITANLGPPGSEMQVVEVTTKASLDGLRIWAKLTKQPQLLKSVRFDDHSSQAGFSRVFRYLERIRDKWGEIKPGLATRAILPLDRTKAEDVEVGWKCPCEVCRELRAKEPNNS